jgi:hypothetical protein
MKQEVGKQMVVKRAGEESSLHLREEREGGGGKEYLTCRYPAAF